MTNFQLTLGREVKFETWEPADLVRHLMELFPPDGAFPSPNPLNGGFAIVLPDGNRLQGLQADRWRADNK